MEKRHPTISTENSYILTIFNFWKNNIPVANGVKRNHVVLPALGIFDLNRKFYRRFL
jgi:hypothetical protein